MPMSEQTMWAVKSDSIFWRSARETENDAINSTVELYGVPWEKLQQLGYRTAKYRVTEVQDGA